MCVWVCVFCSSLVFSFIKRFQSLTLHFCPLFFPFSALFLSFLPSFFLFLSSFCPSIFVSLHRCCTLKELIHPADSLVGSTLLSQLFVPHFFLLSFLFYFNSFLLQSFGGAHMSDTSNKNSTDSSPSSPYYSNLCFPSAFLIPSLIHALSLSLPSLLPLPSLAADAPSITSAPL